MVILSLEISKDSRLAMYLEKLYDRLNKDFFSGELERPVITIQSTARAYGHYTLYDAWSVKGEGYRELNIGAGTLDRPIENVLATLLHEMCHQYNDVVLNVQDCSRGGTYHNKLFQKTAETHGLTVHKTEKYGYSRTEPSDTLLEWMLNHTLSARLAQDPGNDIRWTNDPHGEQERFQTLLLSDVRDDCPGDQSGTCNLRGLWDGSGGRVTGGRLMMV